MRSSLSNFRIAGLTVTTGSVERDFIADGLAAGLDRAQLERVSAAVGLKKRLIAPPGVTALDLCEDAARRLLAALDVDPSSIDAVVFVTQTPDHPQPNNASLLHGRLGLSKSVLSYDLNHGCSGWIYGLHQAALLCAHGGAARVLLCAGDTLSRLTNPADRSVDPIFGDAGSATLVERTGRSEPWHFIFGTDGSRSDVIKVPAGGSRQPIDQGAMTPVLHSDGYLRCPANLCMDGAEVMAFTLREVPPMIKELKLLSGFQTPDALILHQANRFVVQTVARQCGASAIFVPSGVTEQFGNQSSASIPCALVLELGEKTFSSPLRTVAGAFGVGLSWAGFTGHVGPFPCVPVQKIKK